MTGIKLVDGTTMTLDQYQGLAERTAIYPGAGSYIGLMYVTGKLNGEAGEVAEVVFKGLRDDGIVYDSHVAEANPAWTQDAVTVSLGWMSEERRIKLKKELGDVLWYVAMAARELGYTLGEIAEGNVVKLAARSASNVLQGDGSDR